MNLRNLILWSLPALISAPKVLAADDVALVGEPVSYVRACDMWGAGFFYIPNTDTCLKIGGRFRFDVAAGKIPGYGLAVPDSYYDRAEFALMIDARSETELGTLRAFFQPTFAYDKANYLQTGDFNTATLSLVYITLGTTSGDGFQFRVGVNDTLFRTAAGLTALHAYAGGFTHAPTTTSQMVVSYNTGKFSGSLAFETGAGTQSIDSYLPHVVVSGAFNDSWGSIRGAVAYESVAEEWAAKMRLELTPTDNLSLYALAAYSSNAIGPNFYAPFEGNFGVWLGSTYEFTPQVSGLLQFAVDGIGGDAKERRSVMVGLEFEPVPNLYIKPEVAYFDNGMSKEFGGILRFQKVF